MDVFANKIRDFASKAGRFSSNYKKAKKAVLFYQNAGTCLSTVTNPTYNFVDVTSFNEQLNMGSNILALSEMIESWVQSYCCIEDSRQNTKKTIDRALRKLKNEGMLRIHTPASFVNSHYEMTYDEAIAWCYMQNMRLSDSSNEAEYQKMLEHLDQNVHYWFNDRRTDTDDCSAVLNNATTQENCEEQFNAVCMSGKSPCTGVACLYEGTCNIVLGSAKCGK